MAKASISLHSLKETLNRVETKLQTVEAQFGDLDSSLQELAQKFELLEKELGQDTSWTRVLGERLGSEEERQPGRRERLVSEGRAGAARRPPLREPAALPAAGAVPVPAAGPGSCSSVGADASLPKQKNKEEPPLLRRKVLFHLQNVEPSL
ncbi:single-pass membrane and coiled-coil domain-containing protein 1 isoform X2 [Patagioenas fasciata]|uniref:single-pass membrane and coiled-coil domain-containing protein 1 isoform X2 n=1 Tax=Patagioenas fasciata TaxID=372321 RepID=UPI003A993E24